MFNEIDWEQIALRLLLTVLAAALIGFEREINSRPAGLRTTLLVALAACISMIQANLLLPVHGKVPDSYVIMDLMRLPLGILSGVGFIGAGAILRKDNMIAGVTTAATLWFVTVMGLCFGGGQIGLGITSALLGILILHGLRWLEQKWTHMQSATLSVVAGPSGPGDEEISGLLRERGYRMAKWSVAYSKDERKRKISCEVRWRALASEQRLPAFLNDLVGQQDVLELNWDREGSFRKG